MNIVDLGYVGNERIGSDIDEDTENSPELGKVCYQGVHVMGMAGHQRNVWEHSELVR